MAYTKEQVASVVERTHIYRVLKFMSDDVNILFWLDPSIDLPEFGARCLNGDEDPFTNLADQGKLIRVIPECVHERLRITETTYVLESDFVECMVIPPLCVFKCQRHNEALGLSIRVSKLQSCQNCNAITGLPFEAMEWGPPADYRVAADRLCFSCWADASPEPSSGHHLCQPTGDLYEDYAEAFELGYHLAVMPVARLVVEFDPVSFPNQLCLLPAGFAELDKLEIIPNRENANCLAESVHYLSGIDSDVLAQHSLVVFPCRFSWEQFRSASFRVHHDLIRSLSVIADGVCFDLLKFHHCSIEPIDSLPARAGQIASNVMMAGALLIDGESREGRLIGGDVFTHHVTRGLGLAIYGAELSDYPRDGEVGNVVRRALQLYASLLEASDESSKFVLCMSLLEFLAYPFEFQNFKKVKQVLLRYLAPDHQTHDHLRQRFQELTGLKDESGDQVGLRTRIVHLGIRIEEALPSIADRKLLFKELENYIHQIVRHMIDHSHLEWPAYLVVRDKLGAYENSDQ